MEKDSSTLVVYVKLLVAWVGTAVGGITLNHLVLGATLIFTVLQIFVLLRRLRRSMREEARRQVEEKESQL